MAIDMTREHLRTHYKRVQGFIAKERRMRIAVLGKSPKLPEKLAECDDSLESLQVMGEWIAALLPPEAEQGTLFEDQPARRFY